jgi:predicted NACHT family NTPase
MAVVDYNWKRFWCPREGALSLADGGFLYDPESEYGRVMNPDVTVFENLLATPCLVLLGEPGTGKSHELAAAKALTEEHAGQAREAVLAFDLRAYQTDQRLCSRVFESQEFRRWHEGEGFLNLFLDSLDESLLRIETVAALLEEEFGRCPISRLRLRIACRTADWPSTLEQSLRRLWSEPVKVVELVPLRRKDVQSAASAEGLDATAFLDAVVDKNVVPLAIKPVTLRMLISSFRRDRSLPRRQADLYDAGCTLLCDEPNLARSESGLCRLFSPELIVAVASRVAAAMVFGNRYAVWTSPDRSQMPPEDVAINDLIAGTEAANGQTCPITEEVVRETLATGLFTSRGPHRLGWAHQTYAEFLAARCLVRAGMSCAQIVSLLTHPQDPQQRIVPQLHETAAWLASLSQDIFDEIRRRDPVVLLRSDVAAAAPEDRQRLVAALLPLFEQEKLRDSDSRGQYAKLKHPSLSSQLRPYIRSKTAGWLARRVAIDIAEACDCQDCVPDLLAAVLDQTEDHMVRVNAAYAVDRIGDAVAKSQLRPLALGEAGDDPDDDLKGCGLRATWPEHLSPEELFRSLTAPKRENYGGSYSAFLFALREHVSSQLSADGLAFALNWIASGRADGFHFEEIREQVMLSAWRLLPEHPDLAGPFACAAMSRLRDHDAIAKGNQEHPFSAEIQRDHARRRAVLMAAIRQATADRELRYLELSSTPLVVSDDLPWLAEQLAVVPSEQRVLIAKLMGWVYDWRQAGNLDIILDCCTRFPDIEPVFPWLKPVEIGSPEYRKARAEWLKHKRLEARLVSRRNRPLLVPSPVERVKALLAKLAEGDKDAWWHLNMEMTLEPSSSHYGDELEWDLTALPVWKQTDPPLRARITAAAKQHILDPGLVDTSWVGTNVLHRPGFAGYRALALVQSISPEWLEALPTSACQRWAPAIVGYPLNSNDWEQTPHTALMRWAYRGARRETLGALGAMIDHEDQDHGHISVARRIEHCWDDAIATVLLTKAQTPGMKPGSVGDLLDQLLGHGFEPAAGYALSLLSVPPPTEGPARQVELAAAESLMSHRPAESWVRIWPIIEVDTQFGRELLEKFAHMPRSEEVGRFADGLSEVQVGDLYLWLVAQYPHDTDPKHNGGAHFVGPNDSVRDFRDGLLRHLESRGTEEACNQVRRIARSLPHLKWMNWTILEAEEQTRRKTWVPPKPQAVIALGQNSQRRYVENGAQLLDVVCDSLARLEQKLQGDMAAAIDVWDNRGDARSPRYCPKDEPALSGYVARHLAADLRDRGIVVNREVQIRLGEFTDIHVDAIAPGAGNEPAHIITAIIETKGCWNRGLDTNMEGQLVGRYLTNHQCPNGIYLVGWFNCERWDAGDYRKSDAPAYHFADARERFQQQAAALAQAGSIPGLILRSYVLDASLR